MYINENLSLNNYTLIAETLISTNNLHKILDVRYLTNDTFVIRLDRKQINFKSGQHIQVKIPGKPQFRIYTIYSGVNDPFIEILVKEINEGFFTPLLRLKKKHEYLEIKGPTGNYCLRQNDIDSTKYLFIASGTGISPFHSYVLSYPYIDYHLLHGVRFGYEAYDKSIYLKNRLTICTTGDISGNYYGRVTDYVKQHLKAQNMKVYLCGNSNMINDMIDILKTKGYSNDQIYIENYF